MNHTVKNEFFVMYNFKLKFILYVAVRSLNGRFWVN